MISTERRMMSESNVNSYRASFHHTMSALSLFDGAQDIMTTTVHCLVTLS